MSKPSKDKLVNDIENRLDDFFGENEIKAPAESKGDFLEKLKSVVLSIDWEITDKCLHDLTSETNALLPKYENDRYSHALLRMLQSLGRYIQKRKAQAHQDAMKRVMSVFTSLEKIITNQNIAEPVKKQILVKEIAAFKKLKEQIETQRAVSMLTQKESLSQQDPAAYVDHQKFEQAMSAVEKRLNKEVEALKAKLASLQKELNTLIRK